MPVNVQENVSVSTDNAMSDEDKGKIVDLIEFSAVAKVDRDTKNIAIRDMFEAGFIAREPNGPRQIHSKLLIQAFTQIATMMKFLDFDLMAQNRSVGQRAATTQGVGTIMNKGGLNAVMRDKGGVFMNMLLYSDGYFTANMNDDDKEKTKVPIVFDVYTNSNVVLDNNATKMRGRGGKSVSKAMVYSEFTIAEAKRIFGDAEIGDAEGKIPKNSAELRALDKKESQNDEKQERKVEIGYYWNIPDKKYIVFAGSEMKQLEILEGDDYPFMKDGVPYIPIFNFICSPSARGIHNHGLGDYIYELAIVNQRLLNLGISHGYKGADPITILNMPQGKGKKFIKQLDVANRQRSQGKEAYALVEHDPLSPGANAVTANTIATQSLVNEWQMLFDRITNELKRWGINVDAIEHGADVTASQIISEEEARNAFVKQIMEYNASETEFLLEVIIDLFADVSVKNDTPINTVIKFEDPEAGNVEIDNITIGDIASELKKHTYYPRVNARTGVIPSNVMKQAQLSRVIPTLQPGSAAHTKALKEFAALNDHDFSLEDFSPAQQGGGGGGEGPGPEGVVSGTDRVRVNARSKTPEPAL